MLSKVGNIVVFLAMFFSLSIARAAIPGEATYLIITHPQFTDAAIKLALWKNQKGIPTEVVTLSQTGSTADQIQTFIKNNAANIKYVLLMGDSEWVPTFFLNNPCNTTNAECEEESVETEVSDEAVQKKIATDHPYTRFDDDYTKPPSIALGRISVDTLDEASTVVDKIIDYEKTPSSIDTYYQNVTLGSFFEDNDQDGIDSRPYIKIMEQIADLLSTANYDLTRLYTYSKKITTDLTLYYKNNTPLPSQLQPINGFNWEASADNVAQQINAGRFLYIYRDHGGGTVWSAQSFNTLDASNLANGNTDLKDKEEDMLPVIFSIACLTGRFDNESTYYNTPDKESLAENFLINPNGGAASVIASTRSNASSINNSLLNGLIDYYWDDMDAGISAGKMKYLGDALIYAKQNLKGSDPTKQRSILTYHLFGDPTLDMQTSRPRLFKPTPSISNNTFTMAPGVVTQNVYLAVSQNSKLIAVTGPVSINNRSPNISVNLAKIDLSKSWTITLTAPKFRPYIVNVKPGFDFPAESEIAYCYDNGPFYSDNDGDGYYANDGVSTCNPPQGALKNFPTLQKGDCDDTEANINPAQTEIELDHIDNNCNGGIDEGSNTSNLTYGVMKTIEDNLSIIGVRHTIATDLDNDGGNDYLSGTPWGISKFSNTNLDWDMLVIEDYNFSDIDYGNNKPAITDLDNDGLLDLFVGLNRLKQQSTNSQFFDYEESIALEDAEGSDFALTFADIDNNGLIDLIAGNNIGEIYFYEQSADDLFHFITKAPPIIHPYTESLTPVVTDVDNDGLLDLILGTGHGLFQYEQASPGSYNWIAMGENFVNYKPTNRTTLTKADLNRDGKPEFVAGYAGLKGFEILTLCDVKEANACGLCGDTPIEVCNTIDDDCDGVVDDGITCPHCGDGVVNQDFEECDGASGLTSSKYTCTDSCTETCADGMLLFSTYPLTCDAPRCGDRIITSPEQCESGITHLGLNQICSGCQITCVSNYHLEGNVCVRNPYCGDGVINQTSEQCDGAAGLGPHMQCNNCTKNCVSSYVMQNGECVAVPQAHAPEPVLPAPEPTPAPPEPAIPEPPVPEPAVPEPALPEPALPAPLDDSDPSDNSDASDPSDLPDPSDAPELPETPAEETPCELLSTQAQNEPEKYYPLPYAPQYISDESTFVIYSCELLSGSYWTLLADSLLCETCQSLTITHTQQNKPPEPVTDPETPSDSEEFISAPAVLPTEGPSTNSETENQAEQTEIALEHTSDSEQTDTTAEEGSATELHDNTQPSEPENTDNQQGAGSNDGTEPDTTSSGSAGGCSLRI